MKAIRQPEAKTSFINLAEILSSEHTEFDITHFLNNWLYYVNKF